MLSNNRFSDSIFNKQALAEPQNILAENVQFK